MSALTIVERLKLAPDTAEYKAIRNLWKVHSIAEDARDIPGLITTLTENCIYELVGNNRSWKGHDGATAFYQELLTAFPDAHFDLTEIIIGPQGVFEEAILTGTHVEAFAGNAPSGNKISFPVAILFPWDFEKKLFSGEKIYGDWNSIFNRNLSQPKKP